MRGKRDMVSPYSSNRHYLHRIWATGLRNIIHRYPSPCPCPRLFVSLPPSPGATCHLYRYNMGLSNRRLGAKCQDRRLLRGCTVKIDTYAFPSALSDCGWGLGVIEGVQVGHSVQREGTLNFRTLCWSVTGAGEMCSCGGYFQIRASARMRSLEKKTQRSLEPSVVQRHRFWKRQDRLYD